MKLFLQLTGISLKSLISAKKQKPITIILIGLLFCYVVGTLSFMMVNMAKSAVSAGIDCSFVLSYGILISSFFILLFTISSSSNILFKSKDNNLLMPMPLKKIQIVLSRLVGCLLLCYAYELMFFVPAIVIYFVFSQVTFVSILASLVCFIFSPLVIFALSIAISALLNFVTAKLRYKNLFLTIGMFIFTIVMLYFYVTIDFTALESGSASQTFISNISKYLFSFKWTIDAIRGNMLSLLWLVLSSTISLVLIFFLTSAVHLKIASMSTTVHNSKRVAVIGEQSQLATFTKKEFKKIITTPIVLFNNCFGLLLLLIAIVYIFIEKNMIFSLLSQIPMTNFSMSMISVVLITTLVGTCNTASISISLERTYIQYLKCLPISVYKILFAKGLCNLLFCMPFILIGSIALCIFFNLTFYYSFLILAISLLLCACYAVFGIFINLKLPKVDATNDTVITKQSISSLLGVMVPMLFISIIAVVYFKYLMPFMSLLLFSIIALLLTLGVTALILLYLKKKAKQLFINL